jgi:hypothetical protein
MRKLDFGALVRGWVVGALLTVIIMAACPKPTPAPGRPPGPIQCGTNAVEQCAPSALTGVNDCLSGFADITTCLLGLIQPATCVTYETVACLVRHEGAAANAAAQANPTDTRDARRAARAREFLQGQGVNFSD